MRQNQSVCADTNDATSCHDDVLRAASALILCSDSRHSAQRRHRGLKALRALCARCARIARAGFQRRARGRRRGARRGAVRHHARAHSKRACVSAVPAACCRRTQSALRSARAAATNCRGCPLHSAWPRPRLPGRRGERPCCMHGMQAAGL